MPAAVKITDTITPGLARAIRTVKEPQPILQAMGLQLLSLTQSAFNEPSQRAAPWPAKRDGSAATLRRSQSLFKAWRVGRATKTSIAVSNDRPYAAIHQFGGKTAAHTIVPKKGKALAWPGGPGPVKKVDHPGSKIPARPMLPIVGSGAGASFTPYAREKLRRIGEAKLAAMLKG